MIRKNYKLILLILSITLLFTACGQASEPSSTTSKDAQGNESSNIKISFDSKPDMYGQVKKIVGNEVNLDLAEVSERKGRSEMAQADKDKMKSGASDRSDEERKQMMEERIKFTGEAVDLIIPVGIPIVSVKQGEVTQLELGDIYEGTLLQIWLNEDSTVKAISVMQGR